MRSVPSRIHKEVVLVFFQMANSVLFEGAITSVLQMESEQPIDVDASVI